MQIFKCRIKTKLVQKKPKTYTIATNYRQKKDLQVIDFNCKSLKYIGRYIQTRTGDLYDVNVAL